MPLPASPHRRSVDRIRVGVGTVVFDTLAALFFVAAGIVLVAGPIPGLAGPHWLWVVICVAGGCMCHFGARITAAWLRIYKREAGMTILVEDMDYVHDPARRTP